MGTTKEQRAAASAIIEKFTAEDVTFPADFVIALLWDADERDRLAERVRELEYSDFAQARQVMGWKERCLSAEAKLAVAVEALHHVTKHWPDDFSARHAQSSLAKIKGVP